MKKVLNLFIPLIIICQLYCHINHEQSIAEKIIIKHRIIFDKPPARIPVPHSVDVQCRIFNGIRRDLDGILSGSNGLTVSRRLKINEIVKDQGK